MRKPLLLLFVSLFVVVSVSARMEQVTKTVGSEGAKRVEIVADLGAGEFRIEPRDMDDVAVVDITYNPRRTDCDVDYRLSGSTGHLTLTSDNRNDSHIDTDDNEWDITLSNRYNTTLDLEIGACDADFELGGVPLEELNIEIGAASGKVMFSEKNPIKMTSFSIEAGASSLDIENGGNANFEKMSFEGGVGSFNLDLTGEYDGECEIDIEIGLGSAEIYLPSGVPVRIETSGDNWLSSVDIHDRDIDEVDDDEYETDDFESARTRIILYLDVGLGSVDVYRK